MPLDLVAPRIRRGYVDTRWGQAHYRETGSGPYPTLVCLHATAYSGRTFVPFMPLVAGDRRVVALDTPGYGESDGPPSLPSIAEYAAVLADAVHGLEPGYPVDLFGYHTGAILATELAAACPELVRRIVLVGVPFFEGPTKEVWRARLVHERVLGPDLAQFADRWDYFVTRRAAGVSLERGFGSFVDELKAFPRDFWSHAALFRYDAAPRLAQVRQPVMVINPATPLGDASRAAAAALPDASLVEMPDVSNAIFDTAARRVADAMLPFLDA